MIWSAILMVEPEVVTITKDDDCSKTSSLPLLSAFLVLCSNHGLCAQKETQSVVRLGIRDMKLACWSQAQLDDDVDGEDIAATMMTQELRRW